MSKPLRAVTYYPTSTDKQEESIPQQRLAVEPLAQELGCTIIRDFADEGISGDKTSRRTAFLQMIRDAQEKKDFEVILCWDKDRFGRFDTIEQGYYVKPLRDAGIRLITVAQGEIDWNTFAGRITDAVLTEAKHLLLSDLSRNVLRAPIENAKQGRWPGGPPPRLRPPGSQAGVGSPRRAGSGALAVPHLRHQVHQPAEVGRGAEPQGHPHAGGEALEQQQRPAHPCYVGDFSWNEGHSGHYHGVSKGRPVAKRKPAGRNDPEDLIIVLNTHGPLIDRVTFAAVQEKLAQNQTRTTPDPNPGNWLLSGLVTCGNCGSIMWGQHDRKKWEGKSYRYRKYVCSNYHLHGRTACTRNSVPEDKLLRCVARIVQKDFSGADNLKKLRAKVRAIRLAGEQGDAHQIAELQSRIKDLDQKISQGAERLLSVPPDLVEQAGGKLREWKEQRDKLARDLENVKTAGTDVDARVEKTLKQLAKLHETITKAPAGEARELIGRMVRKVELWFEPVSYGKYHKAVCTRGAIHLHEHMAIIRDATFGKPLLCAIASPEGIAGYRFDDDRSDGVPLDLIEVFSRGGVVVGVEADGG